MKRLLDLLFPRRCIFCGEFMKEPGEVCSGCLEHLPRLKEPLCGVNMNDVDRLYGAVYYSGKVPQGIAHLKFRGKPHLHRWFVELMLSSMKEELEQEAIDMVTCVPMHKKRLRKRGYNQSELLARETAAQLDLPYSDCLRKTRLTLEQHNLSSRERSTQQKNSYGCSELHGERVLLVDDVCTTGATLMECARMLKEAGASAVIAAVVCRTQKVEDPPVEAERDLWYS